MNRDIPYVVRKRLTRLKTLWSNMIEQWAFNFIANLNKHSYSRSILGYLISMIQILLCMTYILLYSFWTGWKFVVNENTEDEHKLNFCSLFWWIGSRRLKKEKVVVSHSMLWLNLLRCFDYQWYFYFSGMLLICKLFFTDKYQWNSCAASLKAS